MMWSASNVDYNEEKKSEKSRQEFGSDDWQLDPRLPPEFQVQNEEFYKPATKVDRGHIVRREDNCWGISEKEIEYANADTFHWTNCTPQHERFNQEGKKGLWGKLEGAIQQQLNLVEDKAILFSGPVLDDADPKVEYNGKTIQYPVKFWKLIVVNTEEQGLTSFAFILDQSDVIDRFGLEAIPDFSDFKAQQVTVQELTNETNVIFDKQLYDTDVLRTRLDTRESTRSFRTTSELVLRKKATA